MPEQMTPCERMLAAINHQPVDRIPTDIWAVPEVWAKLKAHFGPDADLGAILHIDGMAGAGAKYVGPPMPDLGPDENVDYWGVRRRKMIYQGGEYWEFSGHPLAAAQTIDDLEAFNWPRTEWFDYSGVGPALQAHQRRKLTQVGYMAPFYFHLQLRGLEQSLMDPLVEPEFTQHLVRRITGFFLAHHRRLFEAGDGWIDTTQVTDDLGMQTGPMISLETFRAFYAPHMKRCIELARQFGIKVFHHDDGAIRLFIPDLIKLGIDVLNPIQWRCPGMEIEPLKRDFGHRLCFHGGIDNQHTLPFGTPEEVRAEVRRSIEVLASDKTGYILAPCHNIQAITPIENILAMYDEAWKAGAMRA